MGSVMVILTGKETRRRVCNWVMKAPVNCRVTLAEAKRTLPQNDRMHAMLTDIARQARHHTLKLSKDDWKLLFLDALKRELRLVPNLDGTGMVALSGRSSSELSKDEMTEMIELMFAYGAEHGIQFNDDGQEPGSAEQASPEAA